jgi:divalent metal cation (Fe/Co/Zn/Cd) transporter
LREKIVFCDKMLRLQQLYRTASLLALVTIYYNIAEGVVSVWFGAEDETVALFGFGLDSFVEVISGIGIWHMLRRLGSGDNPDADSFERRALKITGGSFYLLAVGLAVTGVVNMVQGHRPETTRWGIIVALVSILTMWLLIHLFIREGREAFQKARGLSCSCSGSCVLDLT